MKYLKRFNESNESEFKKIKYLTDAYYKYNCLTYEYAANYLSSSIIFLNTFLRKFGIDIHIDDENLDETINSIDIDNKIKIIDKYYNDFKKLESKYILPPVKDIKNLLQPIQDLFSNDLKIEKLYNNQYGFYYFTELVIDDNDSLVKTIYEDLKHISYALNDKYELVHKEKSEVINNITTIYISIIKKDKK